MARIRTVKPEMFTSDSLSAVTVEAERTFVGLLTQSDDHGRHRDHAAIIAGLLWPLRPEHTALDVEYDLQQLTDAGAICRYVGCDGKAYLHIVNWSEHQKIDKPSASRVPPCPTHQHGARCGPCKSATCTRAGEPSAHGHERSPNARRGFGEPSTGPSEDSSTADDIAAPSGVQARPPARTSPEVPAGKPPREASRSIRRGLGEASENPPRGLAEPSAPGSRNLDPGSSSPTGGGPPAIGADALLGEYIASCPGRPPRDVVGHLGRIVKRLLAEDIAAEHIRAGLALFRAKPMHPSALPSLVNQAMQAAASPMDGGGPAAARHRAWTNPANLDEYREDL